MLRRLRVSHGRRGEDIPFFARLVHLADVFDQLTIGRRSQPALTYQEACAALLEHAGTRYDLGLAGRFVELFSLTGACPRQLAACFKPVVLS